MNNLKLSLFILFGTACSYLHAQIFINTGNPNLDKYKNENPNAIIWERGKKAPAPNNTQEQGQKQTEVKPVTTPVASTGAPTPIVAAQTTTASNDFPPNAIPGKCYARCMSPDQYEIKEETVIEKPASVKIENIPAVYKTVFDTVIVKPATQKTVTTPAKYETVEEDKVVTPATQKWVKGVADKNCLSDNPKDCEVWCLKEVPAVYQKVSRKVETVAATSSIVQIPAVVKVVPRKVLVEAARQNKIDIPATYKSVMKKVLVKKGGFQEWKEVLCEQDLSDKKILAIQIALQREGYNVGELDNQMGTKTKQALIRFQQDKGLPVGNLNVETLKALGVQP